MIGFDLISIDYFQREIDLESALKFAKRQRLGRYQQGESSQLGWGEHVACECECQFHLILINLF
jgi:hypothetical protein